MQAPGKREHGEDERRDTSGTDVEPEHENTGKEHGEECDTDASLHNGPEPADAKRHTDHIEIRTGTNRGRKHPHGRQPGSHRKDGQQEVREDEDHEVRRERRRMQQTQRERVGKRFQHCAQSGSEKGPGYGVGQGREKVRCS